MISQRYTDRFTDEDFAAVLPEETEQARRLYADGVVRNIWLREDVRGACLLLEAESLSTAQAAIATLPLAHKQMSEFTIIPPQPYRGFGPR